MNAMGRRRTVVINGLRLRYWDCGEGTQLLFLHGAALPAASFRDIIEILSRRYRVIVPELPGFGTSGFPGSDWGFTQYADLVHGLLTRRGYDIHQIVGYSFGGGIALHLARRMEGPQRLTLLSPAGAGVSFRNAGLVVRLIAEGWNGLREAVRARRLAVFARIVAAFVFNGARHPLLQNRLQRVILRCLREGYGQAALDLPATVVTVDKDVFFPPALQERLWRSLPRAERKRERGIHLWVLFHPLRAARAAFGE
jgi:pimeloyl-ACP methyl ester carboxylesterase